MLNSFPGVWMRFIATLSTLPSGMNSSIRSLEVRPVPRVRTHRAPLRSAAEQRYARGSHKPETPVRSRPAQPPGNLPQQHPSENMSDSRRSLTSCPKGPKKPPPWNVPLRLLHGFVHAIDRLERGAYLLHNRAIEPLTGRRRGSAFNGDEDRSENVVVAPEPYCFAVALTVDTSLPFQSDDQLRRLVDAVAAAGGADEARWIEWKSGLDLGSKETPLIFGACAAAQNLQV